MDSPLEIELKLEVDPGDVERLAGVGPLAQCRGAAARLVSVYFDTPELDLHDTGFSLRIRTSGRDRIQTVKADQGGAGLFVRGEWERAIKSKAPIIDHDSGPLREKIGNDTLERVQQLFLTDIKRTTYKIDGGNAIFELAVDQGEIRTNKRRQQLCELEIELESGSSQALFDLVRSLDEEVPLRISVQSKAERGYRLLQEAEKQSVKAEPITLDKDGDVADAFCAIARSCMRQFRLNEEVLLETGAAEPLHQARVGLRRLRTAFSLFKPMLVDDLRAEMLSGELHWLAAELGKVRNLDVLVAKTEGALRDELVAARAKTFGHVRMELASARTRILMIDLTEWLAQGDWRTRPPNPDLPRGDVRSFARCLLEEYRRRFKRRGRGLAGLSDSRRHKVRIEAKKLRYATEFFASLYGKKKVRKRHKSFLKAMEELQDHLGELNDMVVGPQVVADHGIGEKLSSPGRRERERLLDRAEDGYDSVIRADRFWSGGGS